MNSYIYYVKSINFFGLILQCHNIHTIDFNDIYNLVETLSTYSWRELFCSIHAWWMACFSVQQTQYITSHMFSASSWDNSLLLISSTWGWKHMGNCILNLLYRKNMPSIRHELNKNIKEWKNSTCWLILVVIVKLWFSVL